MDYKELLRKYMQHIIACESISYLSHLGDLAEEELVELEKIEDSLSKPEAPMKVKICRMVDYEKGAFICVLGTVYKGERFDSYDSIVIPFGFSVKSVLEPAIQMFKNSILDQCNTIIMKSTSKNS